jgi:hypothetical protein
MEFTMHCNLAGDAALAHLREHLRKRGQRLMLDFVPNPTVLDYLWVENHPDYCIRSSELELVRTSQNYTPGLSAARRFVLGSCD